MLKHLSQLMKFKTAMDVRIGYPNEHLSGAARNEVNQPMYATAVGLIMRGFEYLDTYKKSFNAGKKEEYSKAMADTTGREAVKENDIPVKEEERTPLTEKIKIMLSRIFEVEDQKIS